MKFIVIWADKPPKSYRHVLFRYGGNRQFRYLRNWRFNISLPHFNVITPLLRLTKCNGKIEVGLGNYYIEFGY